MYTLIVWTTSRHPLVFTLTRHMIPISIGPMANGTIEKENPTLMESINHYLWSGGDHVFKTLSHHSRELEWTLTKFLNWTLYWNVWNVIRFMLDLIRFNLLNWFYEIWDLFDLEIIDFMRFVDFSDVRILYRHIRFHQFHQISLLCDHQELACTPKDPPRRVDMNERSLISFYN